MFVHTYTKFFAFIIGAFALSVVGLELLGVNSNLTSGSSVTAMIIAPSVNPSLGASNVFFLLIGVATGALITIGMGYLFYYEGKKL